MVNLKTVKSASHEAEMRRLVRMVEECWEVAECYWIVCADSCFAFVPAALDRGAGRLHADSAHLGGLDQPDG